MSDRMKYGVKFDFTTGRQEDLCEGVYTVEAGKRLIKAELGLTPTVENSGGDIRYGTDNPEKALQLLVLAYTISAGGWFTINPMPAGHTVFHLPQRGNK